MTRRQYDSYSDGPFLRYISESFPYVNYDFLAKVKDRFPSILNRIGVLLSSAGPLI